MLRGEERVRFEMIMTMGSLSPEAIYVISLIKANPWELVQVKDLAPVA